MLFVDIHAEVRLLAVYRLGHLIRLMLAAADHIIDACFWLHYCWVDY